jgi:D-alanyl-lipoteichoic acid acyltransferase DltB (MBOAT superfamily)
MLFNSYLFILLFLPLSLLAFYLLRQTGHGRGALAAAIAASLAFYAYWKPGYVPVLVASIVLNYLCGTLILRAQGRVRAILLALGVGADVVALGYFKYTNFIVAQVNALGGNVVIDKVALPLAVSFYTFQQISYLVDCCRRDLHDNSFLHYAFVVTFFPHLIAGPIVRMREIAPQFSAALRKPALLGICTGLALFVIGLGKKVIVADYFGRIATPLFDAAAATHAIDGVSAWVAALAYTLQLYFDFSGYSDMAIGIARMFGFRLAVNFLSPYKAASIAEFWRRWHVTLSRFLRDYIYIPLGGNRAGNARMYLNLLVTMTIGGLWHGAAWTFAAWGFYHGALLCAHRLWRATVHPRAPERFDALRPLAVAITFLSVVFGWVLFRAADFATAATMLWAMASPTALGAGALSAHAGEAYLAIAAGLAACFLLPNAYQILFRFRPALILRGQVALLRQAGPVRYHFHFRIGEAAALSAALVGCLYLMRTSISEFLYFMF